MQLGTDTSNHILELSPDLVGRHLYCIGASGTGKSTLLLNIALQALETRGIMFIDRQGDTAEELADRIPEELTSYTIYWEPDQYHIGFNPLSIKDKSDKSKSKAVARIQQDIQHALNPEGAKSNAFYDRMEQTILRNALRLLLDNDKSLTDIERCLLDKDYRRQLIGSSPSTKPFWQRYDTWNDRRNTQTQYTTGLLDKTGELLSSPTIVAILSKDTLSLQEIMDRGKILIVNLAGMSALDASLLGGLLISTSIGLALERREKRAPFLSIIDEADLFINPSIPEAAARARKMNYGLVLANQYETQLAPDVLDAVLANSATVISFRLGADVKRIGARLDMPEPNELRRLDDYQAIVHTVLQHQPVRKDIRTFQAPESGGRLKANRDHTRSVFGFAEIPRTDGEAGVCIKAELPRDVSIKVIKK